jgi:hypothetical protein
MIYIYVGVAAAIAALVGGIVLSSQSPSAASAGKVQYQKNGLNQNPDNNGSKNAANENGLGDGGDDG